jgi:hypothetical protein
MGRCGERREEENRAPFYRRLGAAGWSAIAAMIGALAAVLALVIPGGGGDSGSSGGSAGGGKVTIDDVTIGSGAGGSQQMSVRGEANGLGTSDRVYAVARPAVSQATPASSVKSGQSAQRWFASSPASPDRRGRWTATIVVGNPPREPLTVVAVTVSGGSTCPPGLECTTVSPDTLLKDSGPNASIVDAESRAVTFRPGRD